MRGRPLEADEGPAALDLPVGDGLHRGGGHDVHVELLVSAGLRVLGLSGVDVEEAALDGDADVPEAAEEVVAGVRVGDQVLVEFEGGGGAPVQSHGKGPCVVGLLGGCARVRVPWVQRGMGD